MKNLLWPQNKKLALSLVLNVEEGSEMSVADGDKRPEPVDELGVNLKAPIRNFGNESNYQYGIKVGARRILTLLDDFKVKSTITAAALSLEKAPDLTLQLKNAGHEICSHGWRWIHTFSMSESDELDFIKKSVSSITNTTGKRPLGWLSRYLHTVNTNRLLVDEGFLYSMDDYSDDLPFWRDVITSDGRLKPIVIMPYALDTNDIKMWIAPGYSPKDWLEYARNTFDWLRAEAIENGPRMMSVGLHLRIIGRPGRIWALKEFLDYVCQYEDVWIATRLEIAKRFVQCCPFDETKHAC